MASASSPRASGILSALSSTTLPDRRHGTPSVFSILRWQGGSAGVPAMSHCPWGEMVEAACGLGGALSPPSPARRGRSLWVTWRPLPSLPCGAREESLGCVAPSPLPPLRSEGGVLGLRCAGWGVVAIDLLEDRTGAGQDGLLRLGVRRAVGGGGGNTAVGPDFGGAAGIEHRILLGRVVAGELVVVGRSRWGRRRRRFRVAFGGGGEQALGGVDGPGVLIAGGSVGLAFAAGGLDAQQQGTRGIGGAEVVVGHGVGLHGADRVVEDFTGVADAVGGLGVGGDDADGDADFLG